MIISLVRSTSSIEYDLTDDQISVLRCVSVHDAYRVTPRRLGQSLIDFGLLKLQTPVKLGLSVFTQRGRDVWAEVAEQERKAEKATGGGK